MEDSTRSKQEKEKCLPENEINNTINVQIQQENIGVILDLSNSLIFSPVSFPGQEITGSSTDLHHELASQTQNIKKEHPLTNLLSPTNLVNIADNLTETESRINEEKIISTRETTKDIKLYPPSNLSLSPTTLVNTENNFIKPESQLVSEEQIHPRSTTNLHFHNELVGQTQKLMSENIKKEHPLTDLSPTNLVNIGDNLTETESKIIGEEQIRSTRETTQEIILYALSNLSVSPTILVNIEENLIETEGKIVGEDQICNKSTTQETIPYPLTNISPTNLENVVNNLTATESNITVEEQLCNRATTRETKPYPLTNLTPTNLENVADNVTETESKIISEGKTSSSKETIQEIVPYPLSNLSVAPTILVNVEENLIETESKIVSDQQIQNRTTTRETIPYLFTNLLPNNLVNIEDSVSKTENKIADNEKISSRNTTVETISPFFAVNEPNVPLECEIIIDESKIQFRESQQCIETEHFKDILQSKSVLETLSIANEVHKEAIEILPRFSVRLEKLNSRIIKKIYRKGFVKISADPIKPFLNPRKVYPKGHYFSRKQNVVYDGDEFDRKSFDLALRRKENIDKEKVLKYRCPTCPYKSWAFTALSRHHTQLHGFRISYRFRCSDCDFTFKNESALKRHRQKHKKVPDLQCPHCPYVTRFDCTLRTHLRRWHLPDDEAKALRCTECNYVSICKTTYAQHMQVHLKGHKSRLPMFVHNSVETDEENALNCEYCRFQTPNENALRRHMNRTHKINNHFEKVLYKCKHCNFATKHKFSLTDHAKLHKSDNEVTLLYCYSCDFKTKWKKYLMAHMRTEHARVKKEIVYYNCAHCEKQFTVKHSLRTHIFRKHRVPTAVFSCDQCSYSSNYLHLLRKHFKGKHLNPVTKTYKCQKCPFINADRSTYRAHVLTHKNVCYICGFETYVKASIRYHIIGHMNQEEQKLVAKIYNCKRCSYKSRNKYFIEKHMRRIHSNR